MEIPSFNQLIAESIQKYWDLDSMSDYGDYTLQYKDVARIIEKMHILFEQSGVQKGDHIAICGRNLSRWGAAFFATLTYGAVAVPILHEFHPSQVHDIVNHSEAKLLFVGDKVWPNLDAEKMPDLQGVISLVDFSLLVSRSEKLTYARENLNRLFGEKFPMNFRKHHIHYHQDQPDELAIINYTSGSTGNPKGVMLTNRSISNNVDVGREYLPAIPGEKVVSMLPLAHMFGQVCELLYPLVSGCTIYFLGRTPTPSVLLKALQEVQPYLIVTVPLVIEKIYKKAIAPRVNKKDIRFWWHVPGVGSIIKGVIKHNLKKTFGGHLRYFLCGGAAIDAEVEKCLLDVHFPLDVGYGMTECGPLIGGEVISGFKARSGGKPVIGMEVRIDNPNEDGIGEIQVKGDNLLIGYYKNETATKEAFTRDGWFKTGDLGTLDRKKNIFIKGRIKTMILGSSGQNIYPEDIESRINNEQAVAESLVVTREGKLVALIFPDQAVKQFDQSYWNTILQRINERLPQYAKLHHVEIMDKEFEKTPKKSIKRFLYH